MNKPTISAIVATLNEEKNIKDCLESLKWVDEIIVVDMLSTDNTVKIAETYTKNIFLRKGGKYANSFSNINFALKKVTKDWVLLLDADERITPELRAEILAKIGNEPYKTYNFYFRYYAFGKFLDHHFWSRLPVRRLFMRGNAYYDKCVLHELITIKEGPIGDMKNKVLHYSNPSIENYITKMNRYTTNHARRLYESGEGGLLKKPLKKVTLYHLLVEPFFYFCFLYIYKKDFLDGRHGLIFCILQSYYMFLERAKLWELRYKEKKGIPN